MFGLFGSNRVAALEAQNAELRILIEELKQTVERVESEIRDLDIESAVENAVEGIDFADMASDAIEEVINNASLSVRF